MINTHKLEKLISEGSSAVYFSLNPSVTSNEIWTKENGLEKSIGAKPGDAVTLIGIMREGKGKESYFLHGVYELIPFSSNATRNENHKNVYKSMIPGVAYMNPISIGINPEEFNGLDKETGPVKRGNKEFLGIVNLDYLSGLKKLEEGEINAMQSRGKLKRAGYLSALEKGKINEYFVNGAYKVRKPGNEKGEYVQPSIKYKVMENVGQGAGLISSKITDKIADGRGFPRPKPGEVVVGIGYFEDSLLGYKKHEPYAFSMVVSAVGDRMQVPSEVIDSMYLEVILGLDGKVGKKLV